MKIFNKISIVMLAVVLAVGLIGPITVNAATAPTLGTAASFSVLSGGTTMNAAAAGLTYSGDIGTTPSLGVTGTWIPGVGSNQYFGPASLAFNAQNDALLTPVTSAYNVLVNQATDGVFTLGPVFTPAPGVWTAAGNPTFSGTLNLTGSATDVWVFQLSTDFTFTGTVVLGGAAQACNVFWQIGGATGASGSGDATINIGPGDVFVGTLIAGRDVSIVGGGTVNGRILAARDFTADGSQTVSGPTCAPATATLTLVKIIVGGNRLSPDFTLTAAGPDTIIGDSGAAIVTNASVTPGTYALSEETQSNYTAGEWSCIKNAIPIPVGPGSTIDLAFGDVATCTIQNTYSGGGGAVFVTLVPPIIDIVKVPNPLALPAGPGPVTYTYTVRNIGTVPMTDVTVIDNTCSSMNYISGDTNSDLKLDINETWIYTCSMTLSATTTNTVTATGWANGVSATDIANATVVVGVSIVPPLIHVTKVPSPLTLSAGGGIVVYTEKVTNPGTVALSNVHLADDKCSSVIYISGDTNSDLKLDVNETWTYTCQMYLNQTTTNTAVATGQANGITVTDFAIVTVVVASPTLPNTGFSPEGKSALWSIVILASVLMLISTSIVVILRKREI